MGGKYQDRSDDALAYPEGRHEEGGAARGGQKGPVTEAFAAAQGRGWRWTPPTWTGLGVFELPRKLALAHGAPCTDGAQRGAMYRWAATFRGSDSQSARLEPWP